MANSSEIAQIELINKGLTTLDGSINKIVDGYLRVVKGINDGNKVINDGAKSTSDLNKAQQATIEIQKQKDALNKTLAASEQKLLTFDAAIYEQLQRNNKALADNKKAINDKIKASESEEGSLVRMRQKLSELTAQYDKTGTRTKEAAKEIDNLSREIGKAEAATNRHGRGVGGYADQLGKLGDKYGALPGPLGAAATATAGFGKQLWLLVMNPIVATIAGIALVLGGLFKAFTSTDSGAVKFAGALKAVSNIADILMDRLWSTFKMLGSLVTFDWEGVKKNGQDAFGGIGKAIYDTTTAAGRYATAMDDIDDREVAAANRMTKLRVDIETLKNKAAAETGKKKLDMLEQAMNKEIELNGIEKGFLKERNDVENMNLASKMQNNKLTTAQKEAQLAQWLLVDDKELESLKQKDSAFAEFMDKNEGEFQTLQKSKADELNKEAELQTGTRRLQKGLATEREAENKKAIQDAKDRQEKTLANLELLNVREKQEILNKIVTEEQKNKELVKLEIDFINKKQALYAKDSKEWAAFEGEKQNISIKAREDILKDIKTHFGLENSATREAQKESDDAAEERLKGGLKSNKDYLDAKLKDAKKEADEEEKIQENLTKAKDDLAKDSLNAVFEFRNLSIQKEMNALQVEKDAKLTNAKLTTEQRAKIEADYTKKANELKAKAARNEKIQALFSVALNTAMGATNAASKVVTLPLVPFIIAQGLIQAALILAQPIPKYAKGTQSAERAGIFGEAGLEAMFTRSGETILADKPTYFHGDKFLGAQITSNAETKKLMGLVGDRNIIVKNTHDDRIIAGLEKLNTTILNKPVAIHDQDHRTIGYGTDNHKTIYLNRLIRN